jgi:magnesium-transporting ATPase (P-type)
MEMEPQRNPLNQGSGAPIGPGPGANRNRNQSYDAATGKPRMSSSQEVPILGRRVTYDRSRGSFDANLQPRNSKDNILAVMGVSDIDNTGEGPRRSTTVNRRDSEVQNLPDGFTFSLGLTSQDAKTLLDLHGRNELPEKVVPKWYIFVSQLWQPMPVMIWIAAIIEAGIQNWLDMAILLLIQFANASIGYYEITKAGDAVAALKKSLKPLATVKRDGKFAVIDAALVVPGDLVLLGSGSAIPADCRVNEGEIEVDEAALTGESLPVTMFQGSSCKMGSTVVRGEVEGTVEFTGANTFFGKTAALLGVSCTSRKYSCRSPYSYIALLSCRVRLSKATSNSS